MDFRHQVPPTISSDEPGLPIPPPLTSPSIQTEPLAPSLKEFQAIPSVPTHSGPVVTKAKSRKLAWLWWLLGGILFVGLLGGGYFAYSRGYLENIGLIPKEKSLDTGVTSTGLVSIHKNIKVIDPTLVTVEEYSQAQQRLQEITDQATISSDEDLKTLAVAQQGNDTDDARHIIQLLRIELLRQGLTSYRDMNGSYPESLGVLKNAWPSALDYCSGNRDKCYFSDYARQLSLVITDIYTDSEYVYSKTVNDYALKFFLSGCESKAYCEGDDEIFVVGTNTMTSSDFSLEKPGLSETMFSNTNALTSNNTNTQPTGAPSNTTNASSGTNSTSNTASLDQKTVAEQYGLAACYVNRHPDILSATPQNELNDGWQDYANADPKDMGCDDSAPADIEAARSLLTTDGDGDGVSLIIERFFGSSDAVIDTDSDGHDDLTEIINHYNPNGPGAMQ